MNLGKILSRKIACSSDDEWGVLVAVVFVPAASNTDRSLTLYCSEARNTKKDENRVHSVIHMRGLGMLESPW